MILIQTPLKAYIRTSISSLKHPLSDLGGGALSLTFLHWVIVGGITLSTFVTLYAVPALYLLLAPYTKPVGAVAARLRELEGRAAVHPHGHKRPHHPAPAE